MIIIKISKPPIAAKNIGQGSIRFSHYDVSGLQCGEHTKNNNPPRHHIVHD